MTNLLSRLPRCAALALACSLATAAETDRTSLPIADPAFKGKIGTTFADSTADFPQPIQVPEGAPNVVVILLDEMDDEMTRLPIAPGPEGLRTGPLDAAMMERFLADATRGIAR